MEIVIDPESIEVDGHYYPLPMGNLYFEDEQGAFPDYEYRDFVSVVLRWWTDELVSFAWGAKTVKLRFMDEHYFIHLIHEEEDGVEVCKVCLGETTLDGNEVMRESEFDVMEFAKSMAKAVNAILRDEKFVEQLPEEAAELQLAHGRLRQLIKKL